MFLLINLFFLIFDIIKMVINLKRKVIYFIVLLSFALLILLLGFINLFSKPYVSNIEIRDSKRFNDKVVFNIEVKDNPFKFKKDIWCLISNDNKKPSKDDSRWVEARNGYCNYNVNAGTYNIFIKDGYGNIQSVEEQKIEINKVLEIKTNKDIIYLYKNGNEQIKYNLITIGNAKKEVLFSSEDDSIAKVDSKGVVTGNNFGTTNIVLSSGNTTKMVKVVVSKDIVKPNLSNKKEYVKCNQFDTKEAQEIDQILFDRVNKAGYGTRAGVIAAARFITLEFNYIVPYFYENGRLENYAPYKHVDGEGRYYHRGLYLDRSKFKDLDGIFVGPQTWGCNLQNYTNWGPYVVGKYYPNGLDCSGFVSWALLNGGFDVGDIGAGANPDHFDLDDLGTKVTITDSLMASGKVKVGDLIGLNGHMAILAGWDNNNYYIAESLNTTRGVVITTVRKDKLVHNSIYRYIILMDDVYKKDGNYTNMW